MKPNFIMLVATVTIVAIVCIGLQGCTQPDAPEPIVNTQEVDIPIGTALTPPPELRRAPLAVMDIPEFVAPTNPTATSCLTPSGESKLRGAISGDHALLGGWEAWAF